MPPKQKPKTKPDPFPSLNCAACHFCLGERDDWECWSQPPPPPTTEDMNPHRGRPIDPLWPACYFFTARENG